MSEPFELAYVVVEVTDRAAIEHFLSAAIGLPAGEPTSHGEATYRIDGKAHRIVVGDGPANDVRTVGYEFPDAESLRRAADRLQAWGAEPVDGSVDLLAARRVSQLITVMSPWGVPLELVTGLADSEEPFTSDLHPKGFVTGDKGMGHAVFFVPLKDFDQAHRFIADGLGMVLTDYLEVDGVPVRGEFYHANSRHHSTALIGVPQRPRKLNHFMIETADFDDVGLTFDRVIPLGLPIPMGLGRHDNDEMFSFYAETPAGFELEFGAGGVSVDDDRPVQRYQKVSLWGHLPYVAADPAKFGRGRARATAAHDA